MALAFSHAQVRPSETNARRALQSRSPSEIRFSDVAHYVGLSLLRDPSLVCSPPKHQATGRALSSPGGQLRRSPASLAKEAPRGEICTTPAKGQLPNNSALIHPAALAGERALCQLEWLNAEQKVERVQFRKLKNSLSESELLEQKAHLRAQKSREMREFHQRRSVEVDQTISKLQESMQRERIPQHRVASGVQHRPVQDNSPSDMRSAVGIATHTRQLPKSAACEKSPKQDANNAFQVASSKAAPPMSSGMPPTSLASGSAGQLSPQPVSMSEATNSSRELPLVRSGSRDQLQSWEIPIAEGTLIEYFEVVEADATARQEQKQQQESHRMIQRRGIANRSMRVEEQDLNSGELDEKQLEDLHREKIREELVNAAGSARNAFRRLDLNGSGNVSLQEFSDGVERLGVKWSQITGLKRPRELFRLFDQDRDGVIIFPELFPEAVRRENQERCSTPDFLKEWDRRNRDWEGLDFENPKAMRKELWKPSSREEELDLLQLKSDQTEEIQNKRKWMSATIRRLKNRGKSDARCREIVALHLPRGTGPGDREGVQIFSQVEVRACKKIYNDRCMDPVENIQKLVVDMKEQKRLVRSIRDELYMITEGKNQQLRMEEERKNIASSIAGMSLLDKVKEPPAEGSKASGSYPKSVKEIAAQCKVQEDVVDNTWKSYVKFADTSEMLGRKGFSRLLQVLCPSRNLEDFDIDKWWEQITSASGAPSNDTEKRSSSKLMPRGSKTVQYNFEQFAFWFFSSDARAP